MALDCKAKRVWVDLQNGSDLVLVKMLPLWNFGIRVVEGFCMVSKFQNVHLDVLLPSMQKYHKV